MTITNDQAVDAIDLMTREDFQDLVCSKFFRNYLAEDAFRSDSDLACAVFAAVMTVRTDEMREFLRNWIGAGKTSVDLDAIRKAK